MLNIAIIGAGRIGQVHAKTVATHPEARLALVCDPFGDAAETLASRYGARSCQDAEDVFADPGVDAVVVGSPTPLHIPHLLAAAKAGKAVLCEKPIALDIRDVQAVQAELDSLTTPVMFGFNRRFDPSFAAVRQAVLDGRIGDLEQLTIISRDPAAPPVEYVKVSGGIFRDMTIHDFDLARFLLDEEPVEVFAAGSRLVVPEMMAEIGDYDSVMIVLRTASGKLAHINNARRAVYGYDQRAEVLGDGGMLAVGNRTPHELRHFTATATGAAAPYLDFFIERYREAYDAEIDAFVDAVEKGASPDAGFEDGRKALILAEAAERSAAEGRFVAVSEIG